MPCCAAFWSSRSRSIALLFLVTLAPLLTRCQTEETGLSDLSDPTQKLEETVMTDMLRIVDHKFDTLTTRITSVERAVSNLQFYSIRQFRQISGAIKETETEIKTVGKQVSQLAVDGRGSKITLSVLKRQVTELKTTTNYLFGELETSVVLINENIDKQTEILKAMVEDTTLRSAQQSTSQIVNEIRGELNKRLSPQADPVNCTVDFSEINDNTDRRLAELKEDFQAQLADLSTEVRTELTSKQILDKSQILFAATESPSRDSPPLPRAQIRAQTLPKSPRPTQALTEGPPKEQKVGESHDRAPYSDENDERVMQALYNMTDSVLQAVGYFKHTGRMLEHILTNSDLMLSKQAEIGRHLHNGNQPASQQLDRQPYDGSDNTIPFAGQQPRVESVREAPIVVAPKEASGCALSESVANNLATVIKNGSQLLEVLTDLAQMSSISLTEATLTLKDEVKRVEAVRTRMATTLLARTTGDKSDPVTRLTNTTEKIFKLAEAVASNTGWLPVIYRHVEYAENLNNRSHHMTRQNQMLLRDIQRQLAHEASERRSRAPQPTISNAIPGIPTDQFPQGLPEQVESNDDFHEVRAEAMMDKESLETIYSTSLQLNRIMPALTKLLAEPDPLFTLVAGGRSDQGRLEIYHNGRWGTYCHDELTHPEADLICRHLGFHGGISAGVGHFGAGAGVPWLLNTSCLSSSSHCAVVSHRDGDHSCSHDEDAGVICDHMLRIMALNGSTDAKTGRLEIHHRGLWLPVCGEGWSGYEARVACQQMGYPDGREVEFGEWLQGRGARWMGRVACNGTEYRLDACKSDGWMDECLGLAPAGVRCL